MGALQIPDRSQWTVDTGDGASEGIVVPDGAYFREADTVVEPIEVVVGATRVNIFSDLPEVQVIAAAADLVPFDLGTSPCATKRRQADPTGQSVAGSASSRPSRSDVTTESTSHSIRISAMLTASSSLPLALFPGEFA